MYMEEGLKMAESFVSEDLIYDERDIKFDGFMLDDRARKLKKDAIRHSEMIAVVTVEKQWLL